MHSESTTAVESSQTWREEILQARRSVESSLLLHNEQLSRTTQGVENIERFLGIQQAIGATLNRGTALEVLNTMSRILLIEANVV